jgi:selenocysteine lyase/cysteine desulfurase
MNLSVSLASQTRLDMDTRGFDALIRASVHYYNSEDEVQRFLQAIEDLV